VSAGDIDRRAESSTNHTQSESHPGDVWNLPASTDQGSPKSGFLQPIRPGLHPEHVWKRRFSRTDTVPGDAPGAPGWIVSNVPSKQIGAAQGGRSRKEPSREQGEV